MKKRRYLTLPILLSLSLFMLGCGDSTDTPSDGTKTGVFIDSPVEGLHYLTPTQSGYTNAKGEFRYRSGEIIKFSLGNLMLGEIQAKSMITPLSLCGEDDLNNIGTKATNIARVLQTLNQNSINVARLTIPIVLRDLNISNLDLESEADLNLLLLRAEVLSSINYVLRDSETARDTMRDYIERYNILIGERDVLSGNNTVNLDACRSCHGQDFEKSALGHSIIVKDMTKDQVAKALIGYKRGTYGRDMKGLMKGQVDKYSEDELRRTGIGR